ncbi:scavenger receptor cysteine-rich type 1 protein M160-like [Epinephelus moara]|uniref:scavenger receptor cysteine-rich type 1 protein M160-like n=1 Tax=Epinephelus moara TaxID=300413 RepID=UPI00214E4BE1|nr:scavenger receptor cysteine-rich type 1 protein M160-like [Epinephelus moara]
MIRAESIQTGRHTDRLRETVDMDHLLLLLLLPWSSVLQAEGEHKSTESVRVVKGDSRCAGTLEVKHQGDWRPVGGVYMSYNEALVVAVDACREMDCGSAVSVGRTAESKDRSVWIISSDCVQSGSALRECASSDFSSYILNFTCLDSVRLVNGTSLCSGRLEVKSKQSNQRWSSVCEADFDQQDAEVVCRELGCGPPSALQGLLYGEVEAPMWTKGFQCEGNEAALLDCRSSGSERDTCSPGKAVGLTCSDPVRLVGGDSRCAGTLELKHNGDWRPMTAVHDVWTLKTAVIVCRELDCGSALSVGWREGSSDRSVWMTSGCDNFRTALSKCVVSDNSYSITDLICSDFVRLVNGTSLCSGRLEVKSNQSNHRWSSVCETDFDQQDAEVVCRELSCGPPLVLQGGLYGEMETPMWTKEFQCEGNESALLDCRSSGSERDTCSPGKAVGLTCSEPVRLVGGDSRCGGTLEVKHQGDWRPVGKNSINWSLDEAAVACRELDCGSAVSAGLREESSRRPVWEINSNCVLSGFSLRECVESSSSSSMADLTCLDSVRLVNGISLCSGRLEVRSNQWWSSVCEADFDQQDAEVVCRELGCEPPSALQGLFYGEVEAPMWTKGFQCEGNEAALLDCRSSGSERDTCSPGKAVGLTCSEPVRLVGGDSRCAGTLELNYQGDWRPVSDRYEHWTLREAVVACGELDCGSAVSVGRREESSDRSVWLILPHCVQSGFALRECATPSSSSFIIVLTCSDSVRLVNGTSLCSGRLEVKSNQSKQSNQRWSSVCDADFDQQDAEVVCRELGCGPPSVLQGGIYGEEEAPMWTREFHCEGNESAVLDCRSSGSERDTCSPGKAVGLTCSEPVRLVGENSRCAGTLELEYQGDWRPMKFFIDVFSVEPAVAACKELGCGSALSAGRVESSDRSVWNLNSDCVLSGFALRECASSSSSSFVWNLICSDLLLQPNISVSSSMGRVSEAQQQEFQVNWGSPLTISCSVQPQYPEGYFELTFTSSNSAPNYTEQAVNHSAHFLFSAESAHQGNYSCVYHVYVFSHSFSSQSRLLSVTVLGLNPKLYIIGAVVPPLILLLVIVALCFYCKARRG